MGPEKKIQTKVVEYARRVYAGKIIVKRNQAGAYGTNGDPDYEFWPKRPKVPFLIEFKAPGAKSTPRQKARQDEYKRLGYHVYECDDLSDGLMIIDTEMRD